MHTTSTLQNSPEQTRRDPADRPAFSDLPEAGLDADHPVEIPPGGWWQIARRVLKKIARDHVSIVSAGVAFYMMVALVPAIGSVIAVYSLVSDPADVREQLVNLKGLVPSDAYELLDSELNQLVQRETAAGWGLALSLLVMLWGASKALNGLMTAMNIAYNEKDRRNFVRRKLVGLALTLSAVLFFVVVIFLIAGLPALLKTAGIDPDTGELYNLLRWPILLISILLALSTLYRFGPSRRNARWHWITPGSAVAAVIWVLASVGLSIYAANFGEYSRSYGSLGAVVLLLLWFYLSGFVVMLGAEINAQVELQTAKDTTTGNARAPGQRGAFVADHVAVSTPASGAKPAVIPADRLQVADTDSAGNGNCGKVTPKAEDT